MTDLNKILSTINNKKGAIVIEQEKLKKEREKIFNETNNVAPIFTQYIEDVAQKYDAGIKELDNFLDSLAICEEYVNDGTLEEIQIILFELSDNFDFWFQKLNLDTYDTVMKTFANSLEKQDGKQEVKQDGKQDAKQDVKQDAKQDVKQDGKQNNDDDALDDEYEVFSNAGSEDALI